MHIPSGLKIYSSQRRNPRITPPSWNLISIWSNLPSYLHSKKVLHRFITEACWTTDKLKSHKQQVNKIRASIHFSVKILSQWSVKWHSRSFTTLLTRSYYFSMFLSSDSDNTVLETLKVLKTPGEWKKWAKKKKKKALFHIIMKVISTFFTIIV